MIKKFLFLILFSIIFNINSNSIALEKGGRVSIYIEYKPKTLIPIFEYNNEVKNIYNLTQLLMVDI